jgi:hypothetical protein
MGVGLAEAILFAAERTAGRFGRAGDTAGHLDHATGARASDPASHPAALRSAAGQFAAPHFGAAHFAAGRVTDAGRAAGLGRTAEPSGRRIRLDRPSG